jgi:hypothetical protein
MTTRHTMPPPITPFVVEFVCYTAGSIVLLLFTVLLFRTFKVRQVLREVEAKFYSDPDDIYEGPGDARVVKAFSVTADLATMARLGSDASPLVEAQRTVCQGKTKAQMVSFTDVKWLVLQRSSAAEELHADVVSGRIKYVALGGAVVRIASTVGTQLPPNVMTSMERFKGSTYLFRIAAAYEAKCEEDPKCTFSGALPIGSDPRRLWRMLESGSQSILGMIAWGWA